MSDRVFMDPVRLRQVAEEMMSDYRNNYRPRIEEAKTKLQPGDRSLANDVMDDPSTGYIYGRTNLGTHHDACLDALIRCFDDIGAGSQALANALACAAEDYSASDGENAGDIIAVLDYFRPPTSPGDHDKWVDPNTGEWSLYGPPGSAL